MPWSGGTYTKGNAGTGGWTGDAGLGIGIEAGRHDTQDNDFATGINTCLTKDGQNTPTANLPMGGYKHTGVGDATAGDEYLSYGQLLDVSKAVLSAGTAPNYTVTLTPAPSAYYNGMSFAIQIHSSLITNAGATLNVNGLGAKDLKICMVGATVRDPVYGELSAYNTYIVTFNNNLDAFLIANPTFGNSLIAYTPTVSSSAGSISLVQSDALYQYITGSTLRVRFEVQVTVSGATANTIIVSLPKTPRTTDFNTFAVASSSGISGYSGYGIEAYVNAASGLTMYRSDTNNFPIDTFFLWAVVFFDEA